MFVTSSLYTELVVAIAVESPRFHIITGEIVDPPRVSFQEFFPHLAPNGPLLPYGENDHLSHLEFGDITSHMRHIDGYVGSQVLVYDDDARAKLLARGDTERAYQTGPAEGYATIYYAPRRNVVTVTKPYDTGEFRGVDSSKDIRQIYHDGNVALIPGHQHRETPRQPKKKSASPQDISILFVPDLVRGFMIFGPEDGDKWQRFYCRTDKTPPPSKEMAEALRTEGHLRLVQLEEEQVRRSRTEEEAFARVERVRLEVEQEYVEEFYLRAYEGDNMRDFDQIDYDDLAFAA